MCHCTHLHLHQGYCPCQNLVSTIGALYCTIRSHWHYITTQSTMDISLETKKNCTLLCQIGQETIWNMNLGWQIYQTQAKLCYTHSFVHVNHAQKKVLWNQFSSRANQGVIEPFPYSLTHWIAIFHKPCFMIKLFLLHTTKTYVLDNPAAAT